MTMKMRCPKCGVKLHAATMSAGQSRKCPQCSTPVMFPGAADSQTVEGLLAAARPTTQPAPARPADAASPTDPAAASPRWFEAVLQLPAPVLMGTACVAGAVAAGVLWWTLLRSAAPVGNGDRAVAAPMDPEPAATDESPPALSDAVPGPRSGAGARNTNAVSAIFARPDRHAPGSKPVAHGSSRSAAADVGSGGATPLPPDRMLAPLARPKPVLPQLVRIVPQPTEVELLKLGLELADEPITLRELYEAQAVTVTSELPPGSPAFQQNYRLPLRLARTDKTPPGAISLIIPPGTYLKPQRVTQVKGKTNVGLNRDECDLVVYDNCRAVWPADAQHFSVKDVPVLVTRPVKFYPSSTSLIELRDLRSSSEAMLFDPELRREDPGIRQMAVARKMGARVNVSAYFNIFPVPRFQALPDAQRALLDEAGVRGDKQARALETERLNRPVRRRDFAAHHRRVEVLVGDAWRIWYLAAERDGRYFAMQRPFDVQGAWFNRSQVRLKQDYERERTELLARATSGDVESQVRLGREYLSPYTLLVRTDAKEALHWNQLAADQKNVSAMMNLVLQYQKGWGTERDMPTALRWLKHAAETGYAPAQTMLAAWYYEGQGVARNLGEARRWVETALKGGSAAAQFQYGRMLIDGAAYSRNEIEGHKWIAVAAQRGYEPAASYLAREAILAAAWTLAIEYMKNPSVGATHQSSVSHEPDYMLPDPIRVIDTDIGPIHSNWNP